MKKNIGGIERIIRITAGIVIVSLAFWGPKTPWAYLGVIPMITGFDRMVLFLCGAGHFNLQGEII